MKIHKDASTVLMTIVASGKNGISLKALEVASALGDVDSGPHFNECLRQLAALGLINICDGIATVWCVKNPGDRS